jgi:type VI secretion system secreted protein Hcp
MVKEAVLTLCRNDDGKMLPFIVYTLDNVIISHLSVSGGSGGKPVETMSLNFTKIKWEITAQKLGGQKEGNVSSVWDMAMNKKP